jgi:hypothetical protein
MAAARGHARRRRQLPWLAWLGSLAALAVTGWILWRSWHGVAVSTPTPTTVDMPIGAEPPEVTQEERRQLDDLLRNKRAEHER